MSENKFLDPQSVAEANPYLGIDDGIEPTLQGPAVVSAQQNEPDAWATAKRKGAALGISPDVVTRNPNEVRKLELQQSLDNVRKTNPKLADWLVRDDNLTLAQDDTESLGFIGRALEYPTEIASGFNRMIGAGISGLGDINDAAASKTMGYMRAIGLGKVAGALEAPILPAWANPSNAARAVGDTIVDQTVYETPEDRRNMGHDVAQGLGSLVGQVVATYVNPALAVTLTAGQGAEQQATRAEQEGASDADKSSAVLVGATITAATEKMGLDILLDRLPPAIKSKAAQWVADKVIAAGVEGTQEGLEQVAHNAVAQLTYAPDSPLLEGVGENATLGALVGGIARTVLTPGYRYQERRDKGQSENAKVDALSKMVQQSKLFERDPQKLADYIAGAKQVGASNVYIPAEDVTTLFQSAPEASAAFEAAGIDVQSVQESLVLNSDVSMPLETYLTRIAPEYHAKLGKAARLSPDGLTDSDVDVDDDQAEAVERFLSSVRDTPAEGEADMRVYNDVLGQLLGRYSQPDSEQMASVVNAFFRDGLGARAGIDPMELYGRYGLRIVEQVERRVMGRVEPEIDSMIERLRAGDIPTEDQAYGPTLAEFLSGPGIRSAENEPMSGEIRTLAENDRATRKGRKRLVREDDPQALTLDYAREAAAEAGYLSPDAGLDDLLAALDGGARSEVNRDGKMSALRDALAEMDTEISRLGLDVSKASNEEIRRALFGAVGTELDQSAASAAIPAVVYRGAAKKDPMSAGGFFSYDRDLADSYASEIRGGAVRAYSLDVKNPLVLDTPEKVAAAWRDAGAEEGRFHGGDDSRQAKLRKWAEAQGYDAIAVPPSAFEGEEGYLQAGGTFGEPQIITFRADQARVSEFDQSNKQELRRGFIQFGQDRQFTIGLTQARDMSTFLHEFGHFALEVMGDVAADAETSPEIAADYAALLSWLGVSSREEIGVEQHEKFARGFERYLGEGTPPTPELAGAFARFRSWMKAIYKSLTSLNVELNDEVRGVMSRMLAGDAAIAQAEQATVAEPLFKEAARAGMTEAQFAAYLELQARAHDEAETRIVSEAYNEVMRERKKWWREESSRIEAEVRAEFEAMPVYRAWYALSRNTEPNGTPLETPPVKLAKQYLVDRYGQDFLNKNLLRRQVYAVDGGVHGDMVAPVFGYETGPALVEALSNAQPMNQAIKAETASRMRDMHGDMRNDGTLPERAMKAVHGNRRLKVIEAEIAALSKLTGEIAMTAAQARAWAQKQVAGKRIKDIVPYQYLRAERKAARESLRAANVDKPIEALAAARRRLANAVMFDEANKARDRFQRRSKWIKAQTKKSTQENLGKAGVEFRDQVNAMLAALSVRPMTDGELARQKPLRAFVDHLQDNGEDTAVAESVIALVDAGRAVAMPEMSVEAFDQAYEAIKSVKHIAGRVGKLLASEGNATVQQAAEKMAARAAESHPDRLPEALSRRDETLGTRAADRLRRLASELDRPEDVIESLDGGESGPWHAYLWGPMNAAEDTAIGLRRRLGTMLRDLRKSMPAGFMQGLNEPMEVPNVGQVSRGTLLGIVLNTGNAQNLQRLRDGGIHVNGRPVQLTDDQVQAMRDLLTADEARYAQGLWDTVNSLWPDIVALQTEMSGIPPEKVEAQAFTAGGMAMRGGYWPLAYDHSKSDIGERQSDDDALRIMMGQGFSRATTPKGHTKGRAQTVIAPLQLDFGTVMSRHLDNVMTDLSYRKAVKDTTRLLRNQGVKDAIIGRLGKGAYDTLKGSIAYAVSSNDAAAQAASAARQVISKVVANSAVSALAMRPDIALGNYGSALVQALDRVGVRSLLRGWWELNLGRGDLTERISALSPFMAERIGMIDEDYRLELTKAQGKSGFGEAYRRVMFTLHRWADHDVTRAAWWGRYQEALEAGETQAESTRLADKLVRQTQTAGARKDVSAIERDPAFRESRIFMGPMFVIFGRLRAAAKGEGATRSAGLRSASILRQMFLAPALFMLLAGRWPEDDDDDGEIGAGEWGVWAAVNTLLFPMQTIPVVREVAGSVEAAVTGRPINPRAAPTAQAAAGLVKASKSIIDNLAEYGDTGEIDYYDMTRDLVALAGPFTGAPAGQVRVTSRTIEAIQDDPDRDAAELARMALYGPPKP